MTLNTEQERAAKSPANTVTVIAGPGSGKTRTLVARVAFLMEHGTPAQSIAVVTFTNAAADEVRHRLHAGGQTGNLGYCGTLHGLMLRLVQGNAKRLGYGGTVTVLDEEQAEAMLEESIARCRYAGTKADLRAALTATSQNGNRSKAEVCAEDYRQTMREAGLIDYDTILTDGLRALALPSNGADSYPHLLVDEVQDSGKLDAEIYRRWPAKTRFYIGDTDQSIFGFRGADPTFLADMTRTAGETCTLTGNYRCAEMICYRANELIAHNPNRPLKKTFSTTGLLGITPRIRFPNAEAEMAWLIGSLLAEPEKQDCAVLLRTNHLVKQFTTALTAAGVPVRSKELGSRPTDWKSARRTLALLANPHNDRLYYAFHMELYGEASAKALRLKSANELRSMNEAREHPIPEGASLENTLEFMSRAGISQTSIDRVQSLAGQLAPGATIGEVLLAVAEAEHTQDEAGSGATVTTMHGGKGREWATVYLPAFEQETIPARRPVEEERRLAFVAFTRAKTRLCITHADERASAHGSRKPARQEPSQFCEEAHA